ncbi:MAG: NAD(P)-dependent oxidoreductase [Planctomycetota bacterium]|nr:NAD(P)-dependent oxidoreductase [Planctomycetota bacterium]
MKICITGGSGFIGSYFCLLFQKRGDDVVILDLIEPASELQHSRFVQGDVREPKAVRKALQGCDAMLNLAAAHHDFGIDNDTYFAVNQGGSEVLCEIMDELDIRRACFFSTVAVYGDAALPHTESTIPSPETPYGKSKLKGEAVFKRWTEQGDDRQCLVIRPTVTFGQHNFANMYSLIRQIKSGRFLRVGPGSNVKSLSYIENIIDATMYLWDLDNRQAFDVFNYIDKPDLTSWEIVQQVYESLGKNPPGFGIPMWLARLLVSPFDAVIAVTGKNLPISGARVKKLYSTQTKFEADKLLEAGYTPLVPLREGINRMVQWYLEKGMNESAQWHQPPADVVSFDSED